MIKNTENSYGLPAKLLHWVMSVVIICLIFVGFIMTEMEPSDQKWQIYGLHKATGLLILLLVAIRLTWRLMNVYVLPPHDLPDWQKKAAYLAHLMLYLFMLIMPASGFLMTVLGGHNVSFYGLFTIEAFTTNKPIATIFWMIHGYSAYIFAALIGLHIAAAFYHHFVRRDNVFMRMLRG